MIPAADRAIGIFDSGVGGLTVARELMERLPSESLVYFGDTARVPYGPKSPETVQRYAREAAHFLLSRGVKMVVVACNTATAQAGDILAGELDVPVVGVVEPGARAAVQASRTGRIGVIGTAGTIASGAYDLAIRRRRPDARVYAQPCPLFVPLVEEGWAEHAVARMIAGEYLAPLRAVDVDVLILGCTHYPLLRRVVSDVLGPGVTLVDSAAETVLEVQRILDELGLAHPYGGDAPRHAFAASDMPLRFKDFARSVLGEERVDAVERVSVDGYAPGRAALQR